MPDHAAVVVVGGGVIGSSVALRLRQKLRGARVVVVERDPSYARASSYLATGGIRQQYESPLNVAMARYGIEFYRRFDQLTAACGQRSRAWFRQRGYLFLADEGNAERLEQRYLTQQAAGAMVERWTPSRVADHVPGLSTHDVVFGLFGPEDGYLDPREVLAGFCAMAASAGVEYVHGAVTGIERAAGRVAGVRVTSADGEREIAAPVVVNAAGAYAAAVGRAAGLTLPIDPVRQHLFRLELDAPLESRIPMVFDPDGTHWRLDDPRSGADPECLIVGRSRSSEPPGENFECDRQRLESEMLPTFARRHPRLAIRSVMEGWAGLYEMTPDHNALLGEHPSLPGFVVAAGFSGHGLMMAPATGRAIAELVADGQSKTFDIRPLAPDRFERGQPFRDGALV
jgi:FAD-dependent oxidoreductase domain-containing protein 1